MVVFTCNHCGDSLQKPKVEKHYQFSCRKPVFLTCVDCLKDFRGDEFDAHVKCISEEQRYGAKGSTNGVVKKGELKQESWVEMIRSVIKEEQNIKQSHRDLLNKVANFNNVPRKRPKFMNFIKSSCGGRVNMSDVEAIWDIIEKYKTEQSKTLTIENGSVSKEISAPSHSGGNINSEIKHEENGSEKGSTQETCTIKYSNRTSNKCEEIATVRKMCKEDTYPDSNFVAQEKMPKKLKIKNKTPRDISNKAIEVGTFDQQQKGYKMEKRKHLQTEKIESQPTEKKIKFSLVHTAGELTQRPKFDFKSKILNILQATDSVVSPEKLRKKVKKLYLQETGEVFSDRVLQKYLKRLKQMENIECTEHYVRLR